MGTGADKLRAYPRFLHPLMQKFIPEVSGLTSGYPLYFKLLKLSLLTIDTKCATIPFRWRKVGLLCYVKYEG